MLIFIDTEFTNFINTELISIGLVSEDDQKFYAELPIERKECSDFVKEVVLPQLGKIKGAQCTLDELNVRLRAWLEQFKMDDQPIDICYDSGHDWTLFFHALNNEVPSWIRGVNIYPYVNDLKQELFWEESKLDRHHALHDAIANRFAFVRELAELDNWGTK
ncbi:hypothetical protein AAKU58_003944 [Oxalobacteraceae bacterium GrIS 1.18]